MNSNNSLNRTFLGSFLEILIVAIILSFSCSEIKSAHYQDLEADTSTQVWLSPPTAGTSVTIYQVLGKIRVAAFHLSNTEHFPTILPNNSSIVNALFLLVDNLYYANIKINAP